MKTLSITLAMTMLAVFGFSQKEQYVTAMKTNIEKMYQSKTIEDYQLSANTFERIFMAEKTEWLPSYYAGYCYVMMAFMAEEPDQIDPLLDIAQKQIDHALAIESKEPELQVLQGMLHQARISVDFMGRGMKYSQMANESLNQALALDPDNPRAYYLMGMNLYSTPKMFGGGSQAALPLFQKAQAKFESFHPRGDLMPGWGGENNLAMLREYEKNNE